MATALKRLFSGSGPSKYNKRAQSSAQKEEEESRNQLSLAHRNESGKAYVAAYVQPHVLFAGDMPGYGATPSYSKVEQSTQAASSHKSNSPGRRLKCAPILSSSAPEKTVTFVGYAYWTMDGYLCTAGEMDRSMNHTTQSKFPCSRAATYEEYLNGKIAGLPTRNETGIEVTFVGPNSEARGRGSLEHKNTLLCSKKAVLPKDPLDGTCSVSAIRGNKAVVCVYDIGRVKRQPSIAQFGYARKCIDKEGKVIGDCSLMSLRPCTTNWTKQYFASKAM